jgi:hypothetical protein
MQDFYGTMHIADQPESQLDAKVTVTIDRVSIQSHDTEIGTWPHRAVEAHKTGKDIYLTADGETLVLTLGNGDFFMDLLTMDDPSPPTKRRRGSRLAAEIESWKTESESPPPGASLFDAAATSTHVAGDGRLSTPLAIGLIVATMLILAGAAMTWGSARLFDPGGFPIARALAGFGGVAGLLAIYLAYFDRRRFTGAAVAVATGIVVFGIVLVYMRAARLGLGFLLSMFGSIGLIVVGTLAIVGIRTRPGDE